MNDDTEQGTEPRAVFYPRRDLMYARERLVQTVTNLQYLVCDRPHDAQAIAMTRANLDAVRADVAECEAVFTAAATAAGMEVVPLC